MIRTFLPKDLNKKSDIKKIYDDLSAKILKELNGRKLMCKYNGEEIYLDSSKKIKKFLLAEKFYEYHFSNLSDLVKEVFSYKKLNGEDRHKILCMMDVPVCPYCNMNYTIDFKHGNRHRSTADLDHFYLKSEFPEYALCLYNFVPACPVCNSKLKGRKGMTRETHIFPHEESFSGKARFEVTNLLDVLIRGDEQAELELVDSRIDERVEESEKIFQLNERYQFFENYAKELLEKAVIYNENYTNELQEDLLKMQGSGAPNFNVKQLVFGNFLSEEEYARVSLGKLKMDLLQQFGIYNKFS